MHNNPRPALRLSSLRPQHIEMTPGLRFSLVCPDCSTWRCISRSKIKMHPLDDGTTPCPASAQRVEKDVTPEQWAAQMKEGVAEVGSRRPTTVLKKVKTPTAPAVTQLDPAPPTAETARKTYEAHRSRCSACTGRKHCTDGDRLARTYLNLLRQEPSHRRNRQLLAQVQHKQEKHLARTFPQRRAAEWTAVLPAVNNADTRRAQRPAGDAPTEGRAVPQQPLRVTA